MSGGVRALTIAADGAIARAAAEATRLDAQIEDNLQSLGFPAKGGEWGAKTTGDVACATFRLGRSQIRAICQSTLYCCEVAS